MNKIIKICLIILVLIFACSYVYAIDMDIEEPVETFDNTDNYPDEEPVENYNYVEEETSDVTSDDIEELSPTQRVTTTTVSDSNLGLSNILNILLIVVGVVIILLAIAILVRLKR